MQNFCESTSLWLILTRVLCAGGIAMSFNASTDNRTSAYVCHVTFALTTVVPAHSQVQLSVAVLGAKGTGTNEV